MYLKAAICDDDAETLEIEYNVINTIFKNMDLEYRFERFSDPSAMVYPHVSYDLVFLDIKMDGTDGIELGRRILRENENCCIFFITDYPSYIDEAFDLDAHRYIPKPIDAARLRQGIASAIRKLDYKTRTINISASGSQEKIPILVSSIIYIENIKRQTKIYLKSGSYIISDEVFSKVKKAIESEVDYFATPHQSFYVNMNCVSSYKNNNIKLTYGDRTYEITPSRRGAVNFRNAMFEHAKSI